MKGRRQLAPLFLPSSEEMLDQPWEKGTLDFGPQSYAAVVIVNVIHHGFPVGSVMSLSILAEFVMY